jgi:hypothetical protein
VTEAVNLTYAESLQLETAQEKPAGLDKSIERVMVAAAPRWLTDRTPWF